VSESNKIFFIQIKNSIGKAKPKISLFVYLRIQKYKIHCDIL